MHASGLVDRATFIQSWPKLFSNKGVGILTADYSFLVVLVMVTFYSNISLTWELGGFESGHTIERLQYLFLVEVKDLEWPHVLLIVCLFFLQGSSHKARVHG